MMTIKLGRLSALCLMTLLFSWSNWIFPIKAFTQIYEVEKRRKERYIEIPFEVINNLMILTLSVNGVNNFRFIYDTGSEHSLFLEEIMASALGFRMVRQIEVYGSDLSTPMNAYVATGVDFETVNHDIIRSDILVLEENIFHLDEHFGIKIAGIIGNSMFRTKIVEIDNVSKTLKINNFDRVIPNRKKYEELPSMWIKGKPYVHAGISHTDSYHQSDRLLLFDTGASITLLLYNNQLDTSFIPKNALPGTMGVGLGGPIYGLIGRAKHFQLQDIKLDNIVTYYQSSDSSQLKVDQSGKSGILGNALISHFNFMIDYPRNKIFIKKNRYTYKPMRMDRTGLFIVAAGDNLNEYVIREVLTNSPAAKAGFLANDKILSVNGIPVRYLSINKLHKKFSSGKDKSYKIKIDRSGQVIQIHLKLADLLTDI